MGISMATIHVMESYGLLGSGRNVLDFGSSNLYTATADEIVAFVKRHNPKPRSDLNAWAAGLAAGSLLDASGQALNKAFVGEMLEEAGMGYDAIDIADGHKTTIVDLNSERLPENMVGAYDTVLNHGTSEHILNQMNVFAAVHAATKHGGLIMHQVPSIGYVDHGYFCYTSRFFFDLAGYNHYEVVDMWYEGPASQENVFASARQYQSYFPVLTKRLEKIGQAERESVQDRTNIVVQFTHLMVHRAEHIERSIYWIKDQYNDAIDEAIEVGQRLGIAVGARKFFTEPQKQFVA
jgi:hypothetical protein